MFNKTRPDGSPSVQSSYANAIKSEADRLVQASGDAGAPRSNRDHQSDADASYSVINEWLTMKGDLESEADIMVRGRVNGNIRCKMLIVDPTAVIDGGIIADEVIIRGTTRGIIKAKRVRLEKTAMVDSEIFQDTFSAEEGARIRGALRSNEELDAKTAQLKTANGSDAQRPPALLAAVS